MSTVIRSLVLAPAHLLRHLRADPLACAIEVPARDRKPLVLVVLSGHGFEILLGRRCRICGCCSCFRRFRCFRCCRFDIGGLFEGCQPTLETLENEMGGYLLVTLFVFLAAFAPSFHSQVLGFFLFSSGFLLFVVPTSSDTAVWLSLDVLPADLSLRL